MNQYIIPGLFLAGTLFFGYLYIAGPMGDSSENTMGIDPRGKASYNRVQNLRQQTSVSMGLKKEKALLERGGRKPELEAGKDQQSSFHHLDINEDLGPAAKDVDNRKSWEAMTIDQRMDEFLAKKQHYLEMEQIKKKEYVKKFIDEARAMGFDVVINDQMEIVSVRKRHKSQ